jgi:cell shape-determining protein MreD
MKGSLLFAPLLVAFVFAHLLLRVGLGVGDAAPDLLTVALLLAARELKGGQAAGLGFFFGLLEDAFSILSFGANAMTLVVLALMGCKTRDLLVSETPTFLLAYLTVGVWLRGVFHWGLASESAQVSPGMALLVEAPVMAIYSAGTAVLVFMMFGLIRKEPQG